MPSRGNSPIEYHSLRWQLAKLLPLWIFQALTSLVISFLPFLCIMMCPGLYAYVMPLLHPPTQPPHLEYPSAKQKVLQIRVLDLVRAMCAMNFVLIAVEAWFFARGRLTPLNNLAFQTAKTLVVGAQWMIVCLYENNGRQGSLYRWIQALGESLLLSALS